MNNPTYPELVSAFNVALIRSLRRTYQVSVSKMQKGNGFSFRHGSKDARVFVVLLVDLDISLHHISTLNLSCPALHFSLKMRVFPDSSSRELAKKLAETFDLPRKNPKKEKAKPFFKVRPLGVLL